MYLSLSVTLLTYYLTWACISPYLHTTVLSHVGLYPSISTCYCIISRWPVSNPIYILLYYLTWVCIRPYLYTFFHCINFYLFFRVYIYILYPSLSTYYYIISRWPVSVLIYMLLYYLTLACISPYLHAAVLSHVGLYMSISTCCCIISR